MQDYVSLNEEFNFCGITYKPFVVDKDPLASYAKCELCDLYCDGRKLCLNNSCHCGSCAGWSRRDGKEVVFVADKKEKTNAFKKLLAMRNDIARVNNLIHNNEMLREQNKRLAEENRRLTEQNRKFQEQLKTIYANINKAIKTEVYKFMTR